MGEADTLRRAMGKKQLEKMQEMKEKFVEGASAGFVNVTLEDGSVKRLSGATLVKCTDGIERTLNEVMQNGYEAEL